MPTHISTGCIGRGSSHNFFVSNIFKLQGTYENRSRYDGCVWSAGIGESIEVLNSFLKQYQSQYSLVEYFAADNGIINLYTSATAII